MYLFMFLGISVLLLSRAWIVTSQCDSPGDVPNAKPLDNIENKVYEEEDKIRYKCDIGYRPPTVSKICKQGKWTEPTCIARLCPWVEDPSHGKIVEKKYGVGEYIEFECDVGYYIEGPKGLLCRADGEWLPRKGPVCKPVKCPDIGYLRNGRVFQKNLDGQTNTYGRVNEYTCNEDYNLKEGDARRTCQANGEWSGIQPVCKKPSCPDILVYNAHVNYAVPEGDHFVGHMAEIYCFNNATMFPNDFDGFVMCDDEDLWSVDIQTLSCELKLTVGPTSHMVLRRGGTRIYTEKEMKSRTELTVTCYRRYELYDEGEKYYYDNSYLKVRVYNGTTEPSIPVCTEKRCDVDLSRSNYELKDEEGNRIWKKVEHGARVIQTCVPDYEFEDRRFRKSETHAETCDRGSIPRPKECIKKRCTMPKDKKAKNNHGHEYTEGSLIEHGVTVYKDCDRREELYIREKREYIERFSSKCTIGNWSEPFFPDCIKARCLLKETVGTSYKVAGELVTTTRVEHGVTLEKECEDGYEPGKDLRISCNSGIWIGEEPCYPKSCTMPRDVKAKNNRGFEHTKGSIIKHGVTVNMDCDGREELYIRGNREYIERFSSKCELGSWSEPLFPVCMKARCLLKEMVGTSYKADGKLITTARVEHGVTLTKECEDGYNSGGNLTIICNSGFWIGEESCFPKSCKMAKGKSSEDGEQRYEEGNSVNHAVRVNVKCSADTELYVKEDNEYIEMFSSECNLGEWSNPIFPVCRKARCALPVTDGTSYKVKGEYVTSTKVEHGVQVTKECHKNYENRGDTSVIVCNSGDWEGDVACLPKHCSIPAGRNATGSSDTVYSAGSIVEHENVVKVKCDSGFELFLTETKDYLGIDQHFSSRCVFGNWSNTQFPVCQPKRCSTENHTGTIYLLNKVIVDADQKVEHGRYLIKVCEENLEGNNTKVECEYGEWKGETACKAADCNLPIFQNSRKNTKPKTLTHGLEMRLKCKKGYMLYKNGQLKPTKSQTIKSSCRYGKLTVSLDDFICDEEGCEAIVNGNQYNRSDSGETSDVPSEYFRHGQLSVIECKPGLKVITSDGQVKEQGGLTTKCNSGHWNPSYSCDIVAPEEADKNEVVVDIDPEIHDETTTVLSTKETPGTTANTDYYDSVIKEYSEYYYDGLDNDDAKENCADLKHGKVEKIPFTDTYIVVCDKGFTNKEKEERVYICKDGIWISKVLGSKPECIEDGCILTKQIRDIMDVMDVQQKPGQKQSYSEEYPLNPGHLLYFDCKDATMEPQSRRFICSRGQWVASERNNSWTFTMNSTDPTCRPVRCDPPCKNGGLCTRDDNCTCKKGTRGRRCETIVCDALCSRNGGTCTGPNVCQCQEPRYGPNCEKVGCLHEPELTGAVRFSEKAHIKSSYRIGETFSVEDLSCATDGFYISHGSVVTCSGNNSWSISAQCHEEVTYYVSFSVNEHQTWAGSWNNMEIGLRDHAGSTIAMIQLRGPFYNGKGHSNSTKGRYIGPIKDVFIELKKRPQDRKYDNIFMENLAVHVGRRDGDENYLFRDVWIERSQMVQPCLECVLYKVKMRIGNDYRAGSSDDLFFNFIGRTRQTGERMLPEEQRERDGEYKYNLVADDVSEIKQMTIRIAGSNGIYLKSVIVTTVIGENTEEYSFNTNDWIDDRETKTFYLETECTPPPGLQLRNILPKYLSGSQIKSVDVICQDGYLASHDTITCTETGEWSSDMACVKENERNTYTLMMKANTGTSKMIEFEINYEMGGKTNKKIFTEHGIQSYTVESVTWETRDLREVKSLVLFVDNGYSFTQRYIMLKDHKRNEQYLFPYSEVIRTTQIDAQKLYKIGCEGADFVKAQRGFNGGRVNIGEFSNKNAVQVCPDTCKQLDQCAAYTLQGKACRLFSSNHPQNFVYRNDFEGSIHLRKC